MKRVLLALPLLLMLGCYQQVTEKPEETPEKAPPENAAAPVALKWEQRTCPYQPKLIDPSLYHDWEGKRIYTCCESCLPLVRENPEDAISKLAARGEFVLTIEAAKEREARLGPFDYADLPGLDDI